MQTFKLFYGNFWQAKAALKLSFQLHLHHFFWDESKKLINYNILYTFNISASRSILLSSREDTKHQTWL